MADIFISHAREDRERAKALADALTKRGWSVWWDGRMPVGRPYSEVIEHELAAARCVVVLWSKVSVKSQWVQNEAAEGAARGVLVPALIDDARIPLEFRRLHTANLADGSGELEDLLSSVAALLTGPDASASVPGPVIPSPASRRPGSMAVTATVITLIVTAVAVAIAIWSRRGPPSAARETAATTTTVAAVTTAIAPTASTTAEGPQRSDRERSAALIVGIRQFSQDEALSEVPYAVDDAIDLAYVLVLDERVRLITPNRVVLALAGDPRKPESQRRFDTLKAAGVTVRSAGHTDVLDALNQQARTAGENGTLFVAFSTHGATIEDQQYLLAENSVLRNPQTAIAVNKIRNIAARSGADQSLVFIDACRDRTGAGARSAAFPGAAVLGVDPDPLFEPRREGKTQVVLSAAAPEGFAYDDDLRRNGVFTAAVIDGLQCGAEPDEHGLVTIHTLARFVEQRLRTWIRTNRNVSAAAVTELTWVGPMKPMALAVCR